MRTIYRRWKIALGGLALLLALSGAGGIESVSAASAAAPGVSGHWAEQTLQEWAAKGLLSGDEKGDLQPDRDVTRAEFLALANRAFGLTETAAVSFQDVPATAWYAGELGKAVQAGYVSGYTDGTFRPGQPVTRQEAAAMLAGLGRLEDASAASEANGYADAGAIGEWSRGAVGALKRVHVLEGFADGTFRPNAPLTRAEAVVALDRLLQAAAKTETENPVFGEAGTYGPESGTKEIAGNVVVKAPGVTLRNVTIKGDLLLDQAIGEGNVTLQNVVVQGRTTVAGGGEHSVHLVDSHFGELTVNKPNGKIRLVAEGRTIIVQLEVRSVSLFEMGDDASVETLTVYAVIEVTGQGKISRVTLHVRGSSFERQPGEVEQAGDLPPAPGNAGGSNPGTGGSSGNGDSGDNGGSTVDPAPAIVGVEDGKTYTAAVTPTSEDADIASVALTKDDEAVSGYELGTAITENGVYALTVTDEGGHETTVHFTVAIPVDLPPTISGVEDGKTYTAAVTPTSEDADIASVTLTKDDEAVSGYELGTAITENGVYALTVTDEGGHETTVHFTVAIPVDLPPTISGVEDGKTYTAAVTPTSEDADIASVTLTKDDEAVSDYELGTTITESGIYSLTVTDEGGHETTVHFTVAIPVDLPPTISGVEEGQTYTAAVTPTSEDADIASVALTKDDEAVSGYELGTAITENGVYALTVTDEGGHETTVHFTVAIPVDLPPTISGVEDGKTYTAAVTPTSEDADIASVTLTKDDEAVSGYELGTAITENGVYALTVTDEGGHETTVHFTVAIPVDLPPTISGVEEGQTYTAAVTPTSEDADIASVTLTKDDEAVSGYELGTAITENGVYALTVTDEGGHATTVHFTVSIPFVQLVSDLSNFDPQSRNLNLSIRVANSGPDLPNTLLGVRMTVPGYDLYDKIWIFYDDHDSFTLDRVGGTDDFVGYFSPTGAPYTIVNGFDMAVPFMIDLGKYTEPRQVDLSAWVANADALDETDALYRMAPARLALQPNYIGTIDDLEVLGTTADTVTLRFQEPVGADSYEVWDRLNSDSWPDWQNAVVDDNGYVVDPDTGKVTVTIHIPYPGNEYIFKVYVNGGLYDGESETVTAMTSGEI